MCDLATQSGHLPLLTASRFSKCVRAPSSSSAPFVQKHFFHPTPQPPHTTETQGTPFFLLNSLFSEIISKKASLTVQALQGSDVTSTVTLR